MSPESYDAALPMGRRERRKMEVHARIIEMSLKLFDAQGVQATKVQDICARADIAHKTFFNHFPSKRHLLREVAQASLQKLLVEIENVRKQPVSTRDRILYFFDRIATNAEEAGPMHRELLTELVHVAHESEAGHEQARLLHDAFRGLVQEGLEAGDVSDQHDTETLTEMLMGAFYALMFNWAHLDGYPVRVQSLALSRLLADAIGRKT